MRSQAEWPGGVTSGLGHLLARYGTDLAVEYTYLCQVRRGAITHCVDQTGTTIPLPPSLESLALRILERDALLMIDDLDTDSVLIELDADRPRGSFLGVGTFNETGVLVGLVLAHGLATRQWSNRDLERAGDFAQGISALLMIDEQRRAAERRVEAEVQARQMRAQMYSISAQSAYAASLPELGRILVRETPILLDAAWAMVAIRHRETTWRVHVEPKNQSRFGPVFADNTPGEQVLDELAELQGRETITDFDQPGWSEISGALGDGLDQPITSVSVLPLSTTDALTMIMMCGFGDSDVDLQRDSVLDELSDDVQRVVARTAMAQRQNQAAASLQRSLLPPRLPVLPGFEIGRLYNSATDHTRVGGDWYDIVQIDSATTGFVVGDVAGHDLRSAALMGQLRHVLASQLRDRRRPAGALAATDRYFADLAEDVMATAVVMVVDQSTNSLHLSLAGHPPPVLISDEGASLVATTPGPPIGFGLGGYHDTSRPISPGDVLVAYTDGVIEDRHGNLSELLADFVSAIGRVEPSVSRLIRFLDDRSGLGELVDDVAALVVRMKVRSAPAP